MRKYTKLSVQWFYNLLERGECDIMDFKEQLEDKTLFGKPMKNFAPKYDETARDVVAFANNKGGFLFIGIVDGTKEVNNNFVYDDEKVYELIHQVQDRTEPTITLTPHKIKVKGKDLLVLEIPFSSQLHRTSRGEFLIRSNNGNRPMEAILRYLDSIETINNTEARMLLKLQEKDRSKVSRLFAELVNEGEILQTEDSVTNNVRYRRIRELS
ncbi:AlbA family DNA-binding domain-containing protein [Bacteroides caecigallinarum]|uniref:AlbA family DNA-binding domain-containing protein n=1 Tax=Bacteroides caecigallinarum TaxID=1411144 RepID=UPI001F3F8808|nr:ATP-binding protein [Bacteroides caecigallinarum]MCF2583401.1 ATP-binding protein [Bacteroides caecigallinarum]